jgi:16S rRNA (uracil1498-N3)-methyltransferase
VSSPVFHAPRPDLLTGRQVVLGGAEGRHAAVVRRIGVGEEVVLTDGAGLAVTGAVARADRDGLVVDVVSVSQQARPQPSVTVVQALPKGDRAELAVETLTEVGVDRIVPWAASRSVTRWRDERAAKALERWRATAREAAKQSRRTWWPRVEELADVATVAALVSDATLALVLHEEAAQPIAGAAAPTEGEMVLVVGPEGGVAPEELDAFMSAGARPVHLGPTVLRTSTAGAVAAGVLLAPTARWRSAATSP